MAWTASAISILDGGAISRSINAYTDGTNFSFANVLLDNNESIVSPATSGLQASGNASLVTIAAFTASAATAANQVTQNSLLTTIAAGSPGNGAANSANSSPVVIATDQGGVPIVNNIVTFSSAGFSRPGNTTTYAVGNLIANSVTGTNVVVPSIVVSRAAGVGGFIPQVQMTKTSSGLTSAIFRVHFFNVLPTVSSGDGSAWLSPKSGYVGNVDVTMTQSFSDPAAIGLGVFNVGAGLAFTPVASSNILYYLTEARATYLPVSGETFSLNVWVN